MINKLIFLGVLTLHTCQCEPPVNSYLPPSNSAGKPQSQYGPPESGDHGSRPGSQGGLPGFGPNSQLHIPPHNTHETPAQHSPSNNSDIEHGPPGDAKSGQGNFDQFGFGGRGNQQLNHAGGDSRAEPHSSYGPPNRESNRPGTSYGPPNNDREGSELHNNREGYDRSHVGFGGHSSSEFGLGGKPESSYGPPPHGAQHAPNRELSDDFNSHRRGRPQNSHGPPNVADSNQFSDWQHAGDRPSSSYGAPEFGDEPQHGGRARGHDSRELDDFYSHRGGRPQNSYGPPNVGDSNQFIGMQHAGVRPSSSYGAPRFGDDPQRGGRARDQGNRELDDSNSHRGGGPQNYYGPFNVGDSNQFSGMQHAGVRPSSSYGAPRFGDDAQRGGRARGQDSRELDDGGSDSDEPAKLYEFSYDVDNPQTGTKFGHSEQRVKDAVIGKYTVLLPDGKLQIVDYQAGRLGYKPQIRYQGDGNAVAVQGGSGMWSVVRDSYDSTENDSDEDSNEDPSKLGNLALQGNGNKAGYSRGRPVQGQFPHAPSQNYQNGHSQEGEEGSSGYSSGRPGYKNGFGRGRHQNEGYPYGGSGGSNQDFGRDDSSSEDYPPGGPGGFRGAGKQRGHGRTDGFSDQRGTEEYSRGGEAESNYFGRQQGHQAGYIKGGPGRLRQDGSQGFDQQSAQGFDQEREPGFGQHDSEQQFGHQANRGYGHNDDNSGYPRGDLEGSRRYGGGEEDGYPRGGPNGLRGSGF